MDGRIGITERRNPRNGFFVLRLHYTADPRKRTEEWKKDQKKQSTTKGWRREYEIDFSTSAGEPVVPEYEAAIHVRRGLHFDRTLRLLRFWDFGNVCPVVLFGQLHPGNQLWILRELCPWNTPLNLLWPLVQQVTFELLGEMIGTERRVFDAGDPAAESMTDLGSAAEWLTGVGVTLRTTRPGNEVSYRQMRARFLGRVMIPMLGQEPAIVLDEEGTPSLQEALGGGFCYTEDPPYKPKKVHPYKDLVDALRYGNDCLTLTEQAWEHALKKMARSDVLPLRVGGGLRG